jgi:glutamate racemase
MAMSIGLLDSGIGGVSVLYEALKLMPDEDYIYYADTKNVPYGTKPKERVRELVLEAGRFMEGKGVKALVVACNTATSIAIEDLRREFSFPVIGMEPAVKPAVESCDGDRRVLVTATPITIREEKLKNLIERLDSENIVDLMPLPGLVELAENLEFSKDKVEPYLKEQLKNFDSSAIGTVVLGCTHFSLFRDSFKELYPDAHVIDGSYGTVANLKRILEGRGQLGGGSGRIEYYNSGERADSKEQLERFNSLLVRLKEMDNRI